MEQTLWLILYVFTVIADLVLIVLKRRCFAVKNPVSEDRIKNDDRQHYQRTDEYDHK